MNRQSQVPRRRAGGAEVALPASSYWKHTALLAALMIVIVGARAHESVPVLPKLRPALLLGIGGGLVAVLRTKKDAFQRATRDPIFVAAAMYIAWATITVPFAMWIGGAIKSIQAVVPALVLLLVILLCPPTPEVVLKLTRGFVYGAFGTAVTTAAVNAISAEGRLTTYGSLDSNDLAAVMAMSLPLAWGLLSREKRMLHRLMWIGMSCAIIYVFMKAGSRGGMIAIVVALITFIAGQRGARRGLFLVLAVVAAIASWGLGSERFKEKLRGLVNGEQDYNYTSYSGRKQVWARARGYTIHHPIFGVGVGNFPVAEGESCRKDFPDMGCKWSATHNAYLQASSELGLPGLILFVLMLVRGARAAFTLWIPKRAPGGLHMPELFASLMGFVTAAIFLSHAYFYLLFALLGLIGLTARARRQLEAAQQHPALPAPAPVARPRFGVPRRPIGPMRPVPLGGPGLARGPRFANRPGFPRS